jgi:uncharacterized flavoprotein (TIGR03862 family)
MTNEHPRTALVVGAGPAGLMAAEMLAKAGHAVTLAEAKPSAGRKFLMAGKSGLNLTKNEPFPTFFAAFGAADWLEQSLANFNPSHVADWARELGQEVFIGSTARVFPVGMKGSPLLRAWLGRLATLGVVLRTRWRWAGWDGAGLAFDTPEGRRIETPDVVVLALGGASWSRLGSDGAWAPWLAEKGIEMTPFRGANVGLSVDWSPHMARHFGTPLKGVTLTADGARSRGECVISSKGLEGGGLYALSPQLRDGAALTLDLVPSLTEADVITRLERPGKDSLANRLRKAIRLDPARISLLQEFARPLPSVTADLARVIKALPIRHAGPRPMDEAISTAGGIAASALTRDLMLRDMPGVFAAGEMLDWEAPTGGYLLTACLATGRWAGLGAVRYLDRLSPEPG